MELINSNNIYIDIGDNQFRLIQNEYICNLPWAQVLFRSFCYMNHLIQIRNFFAHFPVCFPKLHFVLVNLQKFLNTSDLISKYREMPLISYLAKNLRSVSFT